MTFIALVKNKKLYKDFLIIFPIKINESFDFDIK